MHPQETLSGTRRGASRGVVGAIPARWGSTRLPGKPLVPIAGRPLVEHVYRRAAAAPGLDRVVVLTDDERIRRAVEAFGGECELTPAACRSGTDRIAWAARGWEASAVLNIQGDEPLIDPGSIGALAAHLAAHPEDPVATLAVDADEAELESPHAVKVVLDLRGYALYFSRAPIPYRRQAGGAAPLKHLGVYGYQRVALLALARLAPTPLEVREALEQLRALENGIRIRVLRAAANSWGVDTAEDVARVERILLGAATAPDQGGT